MKQFFTALAANFVTIALCVVGGFILIVGIVAAAGKSAPPALRTGSVLVVDLNETLSDRPMPTERPSVFDDALSGGTSMLSLRAATIALREAADDERIGGVLIRGNITADGYGSGYAAMRELRSAVADFRKSKKPVHAFLVNPSTRDYYIASAASVISIDPFGALLMPGMASEQVFFAGLFEKYGIGVQVSRVGRFKAAVEPFTRSNMSPENRLQVQSYLGDMWSEVKRGISESRGVDTTTLQGIVDSQGIILPADAKAARLVDRVAYFDEVLADLHRLARVGPSAVISTDGARADTAKGSTKADVKSRAADLLDTPALPQISLEDYARIAAARGRIVGASQAIAVLYAEGDIVDGESGSGNIGGDALARELRKIRADSKVKAIVLRVNSPGGSAIASERIERELALIARTRPVVVSMGTVAASGGYWISTAAQRVFAQPNTITGSIGVFSIVPNIKSIAAKNGITFDTVKTGRYADLLSISRPRSAAEMAVLQRGTDAVYDAFIERVRNARRLSADSVRSIAEGRVWSGKEAMRIGLVDSIGGLDVAIKSAASLARITGDYEVREYPRAKSAMEEFSELLDRKPAPVARVSATLLAGNDPAHQLARSIAREFELLVSYNDPRATYARMPFILRVR